MKAGFGLSGYLFIDFYTGLCGYIYIHFILERGVGVLSIIVSGFHVHCGCPRYLSAFPFCKLALGFWPAVWICVSSCVILFIHSLPLKTGFGFCATFPFWKLALGFVWISCFTFSLWKLAVGLLWALCEFPVSLFHFGSLAVGLLWEVALGFVVSILSIDSRIVSFNVH